MDVKTYVPISEFYAGKSVFITGGAGFLGKVLLEKLLYSCPEVNKVYVLLRDKKNVSAEQRLQTIIELPMFSRLRKERIQDLDKIVIVQGDIESENLDMSSKDLDTIIEKVSVVIHTAATVKFNETLKIALKTNLEGTRNVLNLCHRMKNVPVFVHISTAYSNSDKSVIEEIVYPLPVSIDDCYRFVHDDRDEALTTKLLCGRPNTYTFTKALAERLVFENHGDIPAVIVRPSIVTPAKDEPVKGWVDNWYGSTGLLTAIGKGFCRVLYCAEDNILDLIPVDYVCNLTLIVAARAKQQTGVAVYNSGSGSVNPTTLKKAADVFIRETIKNKLYDLPYPNLIFSTQRLWLVKLVHLIMYAIAFIADLLVYFTRAETFLLTKQVKRAIILQTALEYFSSHSWVIKTDRTRDLYKTLSPADARLFPCLAEDINWNEYIPVYFQGVKKYLIEKKQSETLDFGLSQTCALGSASADARVRTGETRE